MSATASARSSFRSTPLTVMVVAGCVIAMLSFGPRSVMGLFLAPMTQAHDWSRELFALAIAIQNIMWGFGQPIAGAIADRWGTGWVLAGGGVIYAAGLAIMSWAPSAVWLHLSAGVLVGLGMAAASFSIVLSALSKRVRPEQRTGGEPSRAKAAAGSTWSKSAVARWTLPSAACRTRK